MATSLLTESAFEAAIAEAVRALGGFDQFGYAWFEENRTYSRCRWLVDSRAGRAQTTEFNAKWPCAALVCTVSNFGIELFCAAHGFTSIRDFNRPAADFRERFRAGCQ